MQRQGIHALNTLVLLSSLVARGQSALGPQRQGATANLTITATVVPSVSVVITPETQYSLVVANMPVSSDNVSHLKVERDDQTNAAITYSFAHQFQRVSVVEETHLANVIQAGKIVRRMIKTTTVVPE